MSEKRPRGLSPQQRLGAELRVEGLTWRAVCARLDVPENTAKKWGMNPQFVALVDELVRASIEDPLLVLAAAGREAAETVVALMRLGEFKADEVRLAAASDILDRLGVVLPEQQPDDEPDAAPVSVSVDVTIALERAYLDATGRQSVVLVGAVRPSDAPDARHGPVSSLPVPVALSRGSQPQPDDPESASDGDEPGLRV